MSEIDIINAIGTFMQRVQLNGTEVPAYAQCMQYLAERRDELSNPPQTAETEAE